MPEWELVLYALNVVLIFMTAPFVNYNIMHAAVQSNLVIGACVYFI